jgi:hypothetical protein
MTMFWVAPEVTGVGETTSVVAPVRMAAVTTNCCRTPVSALVSGWTRLTPAMVKTSPMLSRAGAARDGDVAVPEVMPVEVLQT